MSFAHAGFYGPEQVIDGNGKPLPNLSVSVFVHGTQTLATLFTDASQGTTAPNPTKTDALGNLSFYVAPGLYDIAANGITLTTQVDPDPLDFGGSGAVSSVFGRSGNVTATAGDYTAAQVTNAADTSSASTQQFTAAISTSGINSSMASSRYVGATASGSPVSGSYLKGDYVVDQTGNIWVCTASGSPGTWAQVGAGGAVSSVFGRTGSVTANTGDYNASQVTNALSKLNNLSELTNPATARTNLGLGTAATLNASSLLQAANNLSDINSAATARTNLGLGSAATQPVSAFLQPGNNLADVSNAATSLTNLGGTALSNTPQLPAGFSFLAGANPVNTRRVGQTLTSGDGLNSSTSFTDTNLRLSFILPVTPTRFRFKWTNQNASFGGSPTGGTNGAMTFTGIYVGQANIPASNPPNQWNGDFLSAPTQIDAGGTFGSAGTPAIYTTPWFTNNTPLIKARQLMVASIGWTNSGTSLTLGSTQAFIAQGTGCSTDVGTAAWNSHAGTVSYQSVGSWCIEYEYVGNNPIGLWVGDSITAGLQGQNSVSPNSILGPSTRYPERVALRLGHVAENVAALGKSLTGALTNSEVGTGSFPTDQYYSRIWFDNPANLSSVPTPPDYAVILLSTNDFDNRWDNSTAIKSQYMQLVQTLRQGIGIPRVFALTVPPFPNLGTWSFSRQLQSNLTGGSSTSIVVEEGQADGFSILLDNLSTTVAQTGTVNAANFTGTQNLTLTSGSSANTGGGYAQVGGTGGCIIRYTGVSGNNLQNVLFIKGNPVTLVSGTTAIVAAMRITLEDGYVDNSIFEEVYINAVSAASGLITMTVALAGTVAHSHTNPGSGAGNWVPVRAGQETTRQQINAWLRLGPPGIDAVIDIGMATEFGEYNINGTTSPRLGNYLPNGNMPHPYFWQAGATSNAHPRSQAWHNYVAGLISPHLVGV